MARRINCSAACDCLASRATKPRPCSASAWSGCCAKSCRLKGTRCTEYESNLRLRIKVTGLRTYPDASVYCGPMERDEEDLEPHTFTNPTVLFEVLSPSTEAYDRGFKAENYRQIESLRA